MSVINGNVITMVTQPANAAVKIECGSAPVFQNGSIVAASSRIVRTDSAGDWTEVLAMGNYKITVIDPRTARATQFEIDVPDDGLTYDVEDLVTSATVYTPVVPVGLTTTNARLIECVKDVEYLSATYDDDGEITTATVKWPMDGSSGTYTMVTKDPDFLFATAWTMTHTDSGKTVTQSLMTLDSNGNPITKPALTVA